MERRKRNRNSVALTEDGILHIRNELRNRGLTQEQWCYMAEICVATARRLLVGKAIDVGNFYSLTTCLNIQIPEIHIVKRVNNIKPMLLMTMTSSDTHADIDDTSNSSHFGFIMTAIFNEDKRSAIERAMQHLQSFLIDSDNSHIFFTENEGSVVVTGTFSKENKLHIETTIAHIARLSNCKVTF